MSSSSVVSISRQRSDHSPANLRQSSRSSPASDGETAVAASTRSDPSVSFATQARNALSAPPLNATTSESNSRSRVCKAMRSAIEDLDANALVALALRLRLHHAHAADLVGTAHVGSPVRLLVEADDVDNANRRHRRGDHVDLR